MSLYIEEHIMMSFFVKGCCCYQTFSEIFLSKTLDAGISFVCECFFFFFLNQNVMVHKSTGGHCLSIKYIKKGSKLGTDSVHVS